MARKRMGSNLFPLAAVVLGVLFLKNTFWFIFLLFAACGFIGWIKYKFTKKATKIDFIELNGNLKFAWVPLSIVTLFLVLPVLTWENVFLDMMFTFSKVSITLFGGGYVIIPMLQDIVAQKQWLSTGEFWDAIAISQLCPGPILISSAIVGFKNAGLIGGAVTTLAIFAPAAILIVGIFHSFRNVLKHNSAHFISEGLSMAIIALIFYSAWTTGLTLAWDWVTLGLLVLAFFLQSFTKVNSGLLIILGGIAKVTIFYILTL
jgi:chromate transporter